MQQPPRLAQRAPAQAMAQRDSSPTWGAPFLLIRSARKRGAPRERAPLFRPCTTSIGACMHARASLLRRSADSHVYSIGAQCRSTEVMVHVPDPSAMLTCGRSQTGVRFVRGGCNQNMGWTSGITDNTLCSGGVNVCTGSAEGLTLSIQCAEMNRGAWSGVWRQYGTGGHARVRTLLTLLTPSDALRHTCGCRRVAHGQHILLRPCRRLLP
jgi:hypothetical protein